MSAGRALTAGRWQVVTRLFEEALAQGPRERDAWLAGACASDPSLHSQVGALLAAHEQVGDFLEPVADLPSRPPLVQGELLAGRYRIERFLARGGMGEVYEAVDLELGESVALKVLRPELAEDARAAERLRREVQLARKVTHPNACRIFELGVHVPADGGARQPFLTMELLRGETLGHRLSRMGRLATSEALPLALQMSTSLAAVHAAGLVHGDFKSANVMLVSSSGLERLVVTDFGLARAWNAEEGKHTSRSTVGTLDYMAPEQLAGGRATPASDVYACGVVLHEMLTGLRPLAGEPTLRALSRRLTEPVPSPRTVWPRLDRRWESLLMRCLAPDPADRPDASRLVSLVERAGVGHRSLMRWMAAVVCVSVLAVGVPAVRSRTPRNVAAHDLPVLTAPSARTSIVEVLASLGGNGHPYTATLLQARDGRIYGTTTGDGSGFGPGKGSVFQLNPDHRGGFTLAILFRFSGANGANPESGLAEGPDGNLYGGTLHGGPSGYGTAFRLTPAGALTTLHAFRGGADGAGPGGDPVVSSDGTLYSTTYGCGDVGHGTVFKIAPDGVYTILHSFQGPDGACPHGLMLGADGNLYGTTFEGGPANQGTLYRITARGDLTTLHAFTGADGAHALPTLYRSDSEELYGATFGGGASGLGTVYRRDVNGTLVTLHSFTGGSDGNIPNGPLASGPDGTFYGTTRTGGEFGYGTVFSLTRRGVLTTLHAFAPASDGATPLTGMIRGLDGKLYGTTWSGGAAGGGTVFRMALLPATTPTRP